MASVDSPMPYAPHGSAPKSNPAVEQVALNNHVLDNQPGLYTSLADRPIPSKQDADSLASRAFHATKGTPASHFSKSSDGLRQRLPPQLQQQEPEQNHKPSAPAPEPAAALDGAPAAPVHSSKRRARKGPVEYEEDDAWQKDPEIAELLRDSPFLDTTCPMDAYEWFKIGIMVPVLLAKLVLALVLMPLVFAFVKLIIAGQPVNEPMEPWRLKILRPTLKFWASVLLRAGLNVWPKVKGWEHIAEARRQRAILVFNHISYVDAVVLVSLFATSGVAKAGVAKLPFFGVFARALQFLFVARKGFNEQNSKYLGKGRTTDKIADRNRDPRWPLLMIAPEATTKHRHCLLAFSTGAFVHGFPVLPVLLKYKTSRFNVGWGITYTPFHFLRLLCQFYTPCEVEVCPVYMPSPEEKANPRLYTDNVRKLMAERLGCELSRQGIAQNIELKKHGIFVDWTGRYLRKKRLPGRAVAPDPVSKQGPVSSPEPAEVTSGFEHIEAFATAREARKAS